MTVVKTLDGTQLYREAIQKIHDLRARVALIEEAFTAYVTDELEETATKSHEKQSPPILGLCVKCGFPVYESEVGSGGLYHYSGGRYQSQPRICIQARLGEQF